MSRRTCGISAYKHEGHQYLKKTGWNETCDVVEKNARDLGRPGALRTVCFGCIILHKTNYPRGRIGVGGKLPQFECIKETKSVYNLFQLW